MLANLLPFLHKHANANRKAKSLSRGSFCEFALRFADHLPAVGTTVGTIQRPAAVAAQAPFQDSGNWMMLTHPSHRLWLAGGLAFCSECGSVSAGARNRLFERCGSRPGKQTTRPRLVGQSSDRPSKMPAGSIYRTKKLLQGVLKPTGRKLWPNGTPGQVTIVPTRFFPLPLALRQLQRPENPASDSD